MLQKRRNWLTITTLLLLLTLTVPSSAFGYVDPGGGAFVYQAMYAAFLGGTFYFRKLLGRMFKSGK